MELSINEPYFNKDWVLKNIIGFSDEDLRIMEEQIHHEKIIEQRILKLNRIINEINKK
jgi:hypothetical protein